MGFITQAVGDVFGGAADDLTKKNDFRAGLAPIEKQNLMPMLDEQYGALTDVQAQQQALANMLSGQAAGGGPNPAQAQFQQNAAQNAAQAGAAIGSQKGINPALAARLIMQQQAAAGQGIAGQAATLRAQQQLEAQKNLQTQQANMAGSALNAQQILQGAQASQNNAALGNYSSANQINAGITSANTQDVNKTMMGMMSGASSAMAGGASGGGGKYAGGPITIADALKNGGMVPGVPTVPGDSPKNDTVHAMLSPGEIVIPRSLVDDPERAKRFIEEINGSASGYGKVVAARKKKNG